MPTDQTRILRQTRATLRLRHESSAGNRDSARTSLSATPSPTGNLHICDVTEDQTPSESNILVFKCTVVNPATKVASNIVLQGCVVADDSVGALDINARVMVFVPDDPRPPMIISSVGGSGDGSGVAGYSIGRYAWISATGI